MSDIIIASTWGFDQLFLRNYSVVTETGLYPIEQAIQFPKQLEPLSPTPYVFTASQPTFEFTYNAPHAHKVAVAGSFNQWKPTVELSRDSKGIWRKVQLLDASV